MPSEEQTGNYDDIRRCVACVEGCVGPHLYTTGSTCMQNPEMGREYEGGIVSARTPKRVMVIGGGPAGLEAARVAAARGHKVDLYESENSLGGQLRLGSVPPGKHELANVVDWRARELDKLGVGVHLNRRVDAELVRAEAPDAVIVATGGRAAKPRIDGIDRPNVTTALDLLKEEVQDGRDWVVIGGGSVGCEVALFLAEAGKSVAVVEMLDDVAADLDERPRYFMMGSLREKQVDIVTGVVPTGNQRLRGGGGQEWQRTGNQG